MFLYDVSVKKMTGASLFDGSSLDFDL